MSKADQQVTLPDPETIACLQASDKALERSYKLLDETKHLIGRLSMDPLIRTPPTSPIGMDLWVRLLPR
jgi:hypothetical protein